MWNEEPGIIPRETLGDRIYRARKYAKLTQGEMGDKIGTGRSTISGWENDLTKPQDVRLRLLAQLTGVSYEWLTEGNGAGPDGGEYAPRDSNPQPTENDPELQLAA